LLLLLLCFPWEDTQKKLNHQSKYTRCFADLTLLFNGHPRVAKAAAQRREIWGVVLRVLTCMEGMDGQKCIAIGMPHVSYESRAFRTAFMLSHDVRSLFAPLVVAQTCGGESWVRDRLIESEIAVTQYITSETPLRLLADGVYSMHYPLLRMWASQG